MMLSQQLCHFIKNGKKSKICRSIIYTVVVIPKWRLIPSIIPVAFIVLGETWTLTSKGLAQMLID